VLRTNGTNTQRARLSLDWDRPFVGGLGDLWTLKLHLDAVGYNATHFDQQPNFGPTDAVDAARALPQMALDVRWPFMRQSNGWGTQLIEPMAEVVRWADAARDAGVRDWDAMVVASADASGAPSAPAGM